MFALADLKLNRLLDTFDEWARDVPAATADDLGEPERFEPTRAPDSSPWRIDLGSGEIRTILWATGFRPDYSWLHVPVVDAKGNVRHDGGVVVDSPGMVVLGLPVLRRRKSSFIHGAEDDARELVDHLAGYLEGRRVALRSRTVCAAEAVDDVDPGGDPPHGLGGLLFRGPENGSRCRAIDPHSDRRR